MKNIKLKSFSKLALSVMAVYLLFFGSVTFAAEFYFTKPDKEAAVGEFIKIDVFLNTESEYINAISGKIVLFEDLLEFRGASDGNSIVNFWVEKPSYKDGGIIFSGITPGGFLGERGLIFSAEFLAKEAGVAILRPENFQALLNDGQGSSATVKISNVEFLISNESGGEAVEAQEDVISPEHFIPLISRDPNLFDGKYFVVFGTQDKQSGIDYYEVAEKRGFFQPRPDVWEAAESPHLLKDQQLKSWVFVKAVDKNGNERVGVIKPETAGLYQHAFIIIGILLVILLIVRRVLWKQNTK